MVVVVADDYGDLAQTLAVMLMDCLPCDAVPAIDGVQALQLALVKAPAACVLDIDMPRMSGIDVALALQAHPFKIKPKLIALSGGSPAAAQACGAFDAVLQKPLELQKLLDLLEPLCHSED